MRTTVIPAQITTVEDRIAGNFTLTQILLFLAPLFVAVFVYAVLPERLHLTVYKLPLIAGVFLICLTLAFRIKGRIILHWLMILTTYSVRPQFYVFNKNEESFREIILPAKKPHKVLAFKSLFKRKAKPKRISKAFENALTLEQVVRNPNVVLRFQFKKGGINVTASKVS